MVLKGIFERGQVLDNFGWTYKGALLINIRRAPVDSF
jgi:hypothetical protein